MNLLPFLGLVLTAAAIAQTPDNLIGITRPGILLQRDHTACTNLPPCTPAGFPAAPAQPFAGGTAWFTTREGAWVSNGTMMALVDPTNCSYLCNPFPAPLVSPVAVVTGLEHVESLNQTWILDSYGIIYRCVPGCPLTVLSQCTTGLPAVGNMATGGLAVDEVNRLVFYTYSNWSTGATTLHVATTANPCAPFQVFTVAGCSSGPMRPITGLAVDACRRTLFLTDGTTTIAWPYNVLAGPVVAFQAPSCCSATTTGTPPFIGLAVRSGRATSSGRPCSNGACPACPMVHTLVGSPNLGNASFALDLQGAPLGSLAFCAIGAGPCVAAGPVLPPLCGPLRASPLLGTLGPVMTGAGAGCGGSALFHLPLPMIPGLCGAVLSSQCATLCSNATGVGTSMSNCLSWQLQSN
ncbi:MAG: hypothetical protein IPK26_07490 [Planctomycetes bacterium]|nr:hypothetical protein [Planctomycetota bacterium]